MRIILTHKEAVEIIHEELDKDTIGFMCHIIKEGKITINNQHKKKE